MDKEQNRHASHLFTIRLWVEQLGQNQTEYRGQVKHVMSGETGHFRDWSALVTFLLAKVREVEVWAGPDESDTFGKK